MTKNDTRADVRDFLASRRARLSPAQVGLPSGTRRRVPGLRREEVAVLAGVSTEWYTRLEKGHIAEVSDEVLNAVARALQLDAEEKTYLSDLARLARPAEKGCPRRSRPAELPPQVQWMLDAMTMSPAFVTNGRWDVLASNALGRALYAPVLGDGQNIARFHFLDPGAHDFYADWETAATTIVSLLRADAGRNPCDRDLRALVGELSTVSPEFRTRWAAHDILLHNRGTKTFLHPDAGVIELAYCSLELPTGDGSQLLTTYTAEPGSPSEDKLRLLASWTAPEVRSGGPRR
ncbi:helix-turn-helix transcriptional regulator [Winogradskya consettensis]|uniref:Transcriptional regulator n=1 Tax=Winogradskya consettensis TaxID=113560 RepID=A0A919SHL9_9ACTN|nr:helix-turn-helix transcriptional regulator [Actinoplanes consettensis]GIM72900.1 transcriptional regulator [Actinoplanes consettensis]